MALEPSPDRAGDHVGHPAALDQGPSKRQLPAATRQSPLPSGQRCEAAPATNPCRSPGASARPWRRCCTRPRRVREQPSGPDDSWWLPVRLGGGARHPSRPRSWTRSKDISAERSRIGVCGDAALWSPGGGDGCGLAARRLQLRAERQLAGDLLRVPPGAPGAAGASPSCRSCRTAGRAPTCSGRGALFLTDLHIDLQPAGWRLVDRPGHDERRGRDLLERDLDAFEEVAQST